MNWIIYYEVIVLIKRMVSRQNEHIEISLQLQVENFASLPDPNTKIDGKI